MTSLYTRARRWHRDRCDHCGHRFAWKGDARHSFGNRDGKVLHGPCIAYLTWRRKAEERMTILGVVCDLTGMTGSTVTGVVEMRAETDGVERSSAANRAWRVFYDLEREATR